MPNLPEFLVSASILICEKFLQEADGVLSAIRMVDVFNVPPIPPEVTNMNDGEAPPPNTTWITPFVAVSLTAKPGYTGTHNLELKLLNTRSHLGPLGESIEVEFGSKYADGHSAAGVITQLRIGVRNTGTCYLCAFLDGEEVSRSALSVRVQTPHVQA
jgi:hypothetical protein